VAPNQSPWVADVQENDFEAQVIERSREKPVVVDFWAPWCGPCRTLGPILERVIHERGGAVTLAKVNTDENQRVAAQFQIQALPTVVAFRDGRPVNFFEGVYPEEYLRQFVGSLMPSDAEKLAAEAAGLEEADPGKSETLYRRALEMQPNLERAVLGLARVLAAQDKVDEMENLLENAVLGPEYETEIGRLRGSLALRHLSREFGDEATARKRMEADPDSARLRYELGCILAGKGKFKEALDLLLSAGERDFKLANEKVRETMVQIFHVIGNESELANQYRQRLAALLY
jgi:putative thioredoxin